MASIAKSLEISLTNPHLRLFDARRDMQAVADLIEQGFSETLDDDGRRYLKQMRTAASSYHGLGWIGMAAPFTYFSMSGYVWEEDGLIIGNLSLIPYMMGARRFFLIANVVVHADYRRRGIGRALTARAIEHARNAVSPAAWLHVRAENAGAIALYESLGFIERARRTTWRGVSEAPRVALAAGLKIIPCQIQHWSAQRSWLQMNYPQELSWNLPLNLNYLRPGLFGSLTRFFNNALITQWAVQCDGQFAGAVSWQSRQSRPNTLWLAAPNNADEAAIQALLLHARRDIPHNLPLTLDYPAGQSETAIQSAGFCNHQTLIWMEIKF
jgi:ribosomal protein S18 acetylase RimI-like enzyme